jgi:peptide/nickel transport system ATP-binding protein
MERCATDAPPAFDLTDKHSTRCWLYADDAEAKAKLADNRVAVEISTRPLRKEDAPASGI